MFSVRSALGGVVVASLALGAPEATFAQGPAYITQWGTNGAGIGQFRNPWDVAVDANGNVFVSDTGNNRIQKFSNSGALITTWGSGGTESGLFNDVRAIAVDHDGNVYVADTQNRRVQKFSNAGAYITQWGTPGTGNGEFNIPYGLAVDGDGNVYVSEAQGNIDRIQKFTANGIYLTQWGTPGSGVGQFNEPLGVVTDGSNNVYVSEWEVAGSRVQKFTSGGTWLRQWGSFGSGAGQFANARGMAIDASGNVYVTDAINFRIQVFTADGVYITQWGTRGSGNGQFELPTGVAVDASGNVFVVDRGNHRIQRFGPLPPLVPVVTDVVGRGSVTRLPGFPAYSPGTPLSLTAIPEAGARFAGWSGDTTTTQATLSITVQHPLHYVATFETDPTAAPNLVAVSDVPHDQGSSVTIHWQASPIDTGVVPGVLRCYQIQRRALPPPHAPWSAIDSVGAASLSSYAHVVTTPADSTLTNTAIFRYRLVALANADTAQWISNEVNGYSVDNLAPPAPGSVTGTMASGLASFFWPAVTVVDLAGYRIYRGLEPSPPPDTAHLVGTTTGTGFTDSPGYFANYAVTAVDVHGNQSAATAFVPVNSVDVPRQDAPQFLTVGTPSPSPMRRSMSLSLGLPRAMKATVDVLDTQGRLVRRIFDGERPAGWGTLSWDARDAQGQGVGPGMYFLCVRTPDGTKTRRLVVIP